MLCDCTCYAILFYTILFYTVLYYSILFYTYTLFTSPLHRYDSGVQQFGSWAINNLALAGEDVRRKLRKAGVIEVTLHTMLCYAVLCCVWCGVLCYAVLCCAMLCYAMLCYAMI
jgi:hypothetical protein